MTLLEAHEQAGHLPDVRLFLPRDTGLDSQGRRVGKGEPHGLGSDVGERLKRLSRLQAWLPMVRKEGRISSHGVPYSRVMFRTDNAGGSGC